MDIPEPLSPYARAAARLLAAALAPLAVAGLGIFAPLSIEALPGASWVVPAVAGGAAVVLGSAMAVVLALALIGARPPAMLQAGALGALTAGLAVVAVTGALAGSEPEPGRNVAAAGAIAAAMLLTARLVPAQGEDGLGARVAVAVGVFVAAELALAATLLMALPEELVAWAYLSAAALALAASLPAISRAEAMTGGALLAMAMARGGTFEETIGMVALAVAGATLVVDSAARHRRHGERASAVVAPVDPAWPPQATQATQATQAVSLRDMPSADDDANRLMRELRGTIEELMEARRTVELQRAEIARSAAVDQLTGVASRRAILERLRLEAAEARRYDHPIAVVLVDLDGFGALNQAHGMEAGDAILREVALRLRLRMRAADGLGRLGSDSFVAVLPHTDERGAAIFADSLLRRLAARPFVTPGGEVTLAFSVGVAFMRPPQELTDEELVSAAQEALASARAAGGNRIAFDRLHGLVRLEERREEERHLPPAVGDVEPSEAS